MNVLTQVRQTAADVLQVALDAVDGSSTPAQFGAWDSVNHLNLMVALESYFGIEFDPEELDRMTSIASIATLVESKLG